MFRNPAEERCRPFEGSNGRLTIKPPALKVREILSEVKPTPATLL
jgi:hypothetical protein